MIFLAEPNNAGNKEDCGVFKKRSDATQTFLLDTDCRNEKNYICSPLNVQSHPVRKVYNLQQDDINAEDNYAVNGCISSVFKVANDEF